MKITENSIWETDKGYICWVDDLDRYDGDKPARVWFGGVRYPIGLDGSTDYEEWYGKLTECIYDGGDDDRAFEIFRELDNAEY